MSQVIITRGVMASGKSTDAIKWLHYGPNRIRVNRNDIRYQLYGTYWGHPIDENVVSVVEESTILAALKAGQDVIVDATHLAAKNANRIVKIARKGGADKISFMDFPVTLDLAITRDKFRQAKGERHVGEDVIRKTFERFHINPMTGVLPKAPLIEQFEPLVFEPYVQTPGAPRAIIVDIDGTIAHHNGRNPYDTTRYHEDTVDEAVQLVLSAWMDYSNNSDSVIIMSGRDEAYREVTEEWLRVNGVYWDFFYMRPEGDVRNDAIVKNELFEKYVAGFFNIDFVLDDRQRVVDMYRSKGLKVLQVDYGNF